MKQRIFSLVSAMILAAAMAAPALAAKSPSSYSANGGLISEAYGGGRYLVTSDGNLWYWGEKNVTNGVCDPPKKVKSGVRSIVDNNHIITQDGVLYRLKDATDGKKGTVEKDILDAAKLGYVKTDGSLWTWEITWNNGKKGKTTPQKVLDDVVAVESSGLDSAFSLALKKDGTLWAWGSNNLGQLANGTTSGEKTQTPVQVMGNVVSFAVDGSTGFAVTADGVLYGWGENLQEGISAEYNSPKIGTNSKQTVFTKPTKIIDGVKSVTGSGSYMYVIKQDNSLWGWTSTYLGMVGNGDKGFVKKPVKIMNNVMAADYGTAIQADGSVWAWGLNNVGDNGHVLEGTKPHKNRTGTGSGETWVLAPERVQGISY